MLPIEGGAIPARDCAERGTPVTDEREPRRVASMIDMAGEHSFPASDPPAVWTWDVSSGSQVADDRPADARPER